MDENEEFFLDHDCLLEIMNYVISNRKLKEPRKAKIDDDLISFVLAHEFFLQLFEAHHKLLYEDLQLDLACRITKLLIDLRVNGSSNENEFFWSSQLQYIGEKIPFNVKLYFGYQKNVIIETKEISTDLTITEDLRLSVNVTGKALINICTSIPSLRKLVLGSSGIHGGLPNTVPNCENLEELRIALSSGGGAAQFASLAKLPNLKTFVISGIQASGSQVQFFIDLRKWHRPKNLQPLTLIIEDFISGESQPITIAIFDSLKNFRIYQLSTYSRLIRGEYVLYQMLENSNSNEESGVTITVGKSVEFTFNRCKKQLVIKLDKDSDISQMGALSKLPDLNRLVIHKKCNYLNYPNTIANFLQSMVPNGSFALKSVNFNYQISEEECIELAKIKSIRFLKCHFSKWNLIKSLNQLTNMQHLQIQVRRDIIDNNTSTLIPNLLAACHVQASIICEDFHIILNKKEKHLKICLKGCPKADFLTPLAQLTGVSILEISGKSLRSLNGLLKAFATNSLSPIEELQISELENIRFQDVSNVQEIQTIKKMSCSLSNPTGIEQLANLNNLEDLTISGVNLRPLFTKLAEKNIIKSIRYFEDLVPKEVMTVSRINSLRKLDCSFSDLEDIQSLSELSNSSIEELIVNIITYNSSDSLHKLFAAFSSNSTTRLEQLKIRNKPIDITEMSEISKIKGLKKLNAKFVNSECAQYLVRLPHLEHLEIKQFSKNEINPLVNPLRDLAHKSPSTLRKLDLNDFIGYSECKYLSQLEALESLKCKLRNETAIEVLVNIKSLKELIISDAKDSLSELYRAFGLKSKSTLQELHTPIGFSDEIREISQIKSLIKLHIDYKETCNNLSDLGQLNELKSLQIVEKYPARIDSNSLLPVFQSCLMLDCVTLKFEEWVTLALNFVSEVNTILKSVRNSTLQKPVNLTIFKKSTFPKFHVEEIDEAYLNVSYSYEPHYEVVEICSGDDESDDSESFDMDWYY